MESYFYLLASVFWLAGMVGLVKLFATHKQNRQMINLQRLYSRELAEALVGKKIDWDN